MIRTPLVILSLSVYATASIHQLQSFKSAFAEAGIQGCISTSSSAENATVIIQNCNTEDVLKHSWDFELWTPPPNPKDSPPQQVKIYDDK
ncbi:hypothetical protein V5O48_018832, partial [Marasmius crinis-equi]